MSDFVIQLSGIAKQYKMFRSKRHRILDLLGFSVERKYYDEFWALRDIDLTVPRGARIGLIGHNGAGKSTLLKIISGQITPTTGEVRVDGKIQALMELGTGFHPEFSGRENIFSALAYQGVTGRLAVEKYHEILEFSELEDFIDNPVKTYSAGMYARLSFSAATAIQPEILIIDEILGAGDAYFAGKCVGRMKELTGGGTTVLFVSHDMSSVQQLCDHAIWLERGRIRQSGNTLDVSKKYMKNVRDREEKRLSRLNQRLLPDHSVIGGEEGSTSLLFHFIVAGWKKPVQEHPVSRLVVADNNNGVLAEIETGNAADNDPACANHLIVQRNVMEWDDAETLAGRYCRRFKDVGGSYLHAPFQFQLDHFLEAGTELTLHIEYYDIGDELFHVELYAGGKYTRVGTIVPEGKKCWKSVTFPLQILTENREESDQRENSAQGEQTEKETVTEDERYGSGEVKIASFHFCDAEGEKRHTLISGEKVWAKMLIEPEITVVDPVAVVAVYRLDGICALQVISCLDGLMLGEMSTRRELSIVFDPLLLGPGDYIVSLALFKEFDLLSPSEPPAYDVHDRCYSLKVLPPDGINVDLGIVNQPVEWLLTNSVQEKI